MKFGADQILSGGQGVLIVLPGGLAGEISGTVSLDTLTGGAVKLGGTFALAINQTGAAVTESTALNGETLTLNLPKGPFIRIAGTDVELTIAGQTLGGNFAFERVGTTTVIAASNVHFSLGGVVNLTAGEGAFVFQGTGLAGKLSGTISLALPGIELGGTLALEINTSNVAIDRAVTVGGVTSQLKVDAGNFLRVGGKGVTLTIAGQKLAGDVFFEQTTIAGAKVTQDRDRQRDALPRRPGRRHGAQRHPERHRRVHRLPGGCLGRAERDGRAGRDRQQPRSRCRRSPSASASTPRSPPRWCASSSRRRPTSRSRSSASSSAARSPSSASPAPAPTRSSAPPTTRRSSASPPPTSRLFLGSGDIGVTISGGAGRFLITKAGDRRRLLATATIKLADGIQAGPVAVAFAVNTITTAVNESFTVGGKTSTLTLPAGPYLRASLTGLTIEIAGQRVTADFAFEKVMVSGSPVTRISVTNFGLRIGADGRDFVVVSNGSGLLTITTAGVTGEIAATVALNVPGVTFSGSFKVQFDTVTKKRQGHGHEPRARRPGPEAQRRVHVREGRRRQRRRRRPQRQARARQRHHDAGHGHGSPRARSCCATTASPRR